MPVPFIFLDIVPDRGRALYIESLLRIGIGVTERRSTTTTVVSDDDGQIRVHTVSGDDVNLSRDIAPDDLAQVVKCALALSDARTNFRPSDELERLSLQARTLVHDANNALEPILVATRRLRDSGPETNALAQQALSCGSYMATMFRKFLSPRTTLSEESLDVNLAILELMGLLEATALQPDRITTRLAPNLPRVVIDSNDLARVVINLVANARNVVTDASPIILATSTVQPAEDDASGVPAGLWVLIEVAATGNGMAPFPLAHTTWPFITTEKASAGTGLGLSRALHLVREAGGHLGINSAEGVLTRVGVFLPA